MFNPAPLPKDPRREAQRVWTTRIIVPTIFGAIILGIARNCPAAVDCTLNFFGVRP